MLVSPQPLKQALQCLQQGQGWRWWWWWWWWWRGRWGWWWWSIPSSVRASREAPSARRTLNNPIIFLETYFWIFSNRSNIIDNLFKKLTLLSDGAHWLQPRVTLSSYLRPDGTLSWPPSSSPPSASISTSTLSSIFQIYWCPFCSKNMCSFQILGPGRPSAGGPRWDRRSNTLTHASLRACGAQLGGSVWKQGKWQIPLNMESV